MGGYYFLGILLGEMSCGMKRVSCKTLKLKCEQTTIASKLITLNDENSKIKATWNFYITKYKRIPPLHVKLEKLKTM